MKVVCDSCKVMVINGKPCHEQGCTGHFVFKKSGYEYVQLRVLNDKSEAGRILVRDSMDLKDIIKQLKRSGLIGKTRHIRSFELTNDDHLIVKRTDEPIYQFERE